MADQSQLVDVYPRGNSDWVNPGGALSTTTNLIRKIELYVNNAFCNPEVHSIYIKRIGFTLIRVFRQQIASCQNAQDSILLQQLKWPIETLYVGMRIEDYNSTNESIRRQHLDKWHKFTQITEAVYQDTGFDEYRYETLTGTTVALNVLAAPVDTILGVGTDFDGTIAGGAAEVAAGDFVVIHGVPYAVESVVDATHILVQNAGTGFFQPLPAVDVPATADFFKYTRVPKSTRVSFETRTIDELSILAHGIALFNAFPTMFYSSYLSFQFGGHNINTPTDSGALMVNFCLYPGTYQPSGHINISRAREFYLNYSSSIISSSTRGTLVVVGIAINFLLISDGSAVLRYST